MSPIPPEITIEEFAISSTDKEFVEHEDRNASYLYAARNAAREELFRSKNNNIIYNNSYYTNYPIDQINPMLQMPPEKPSDLTTETPPTNANNNDHHHHPSASSSMLLLMKVPPMSSELCDATSPADVPVLPTDHVSPSPIVQPPSSSSAEANNTPADAVEDDFISSANIILCQESVDLQDQSFHSNSSHHNESQLLAETLAAGHFASSEIIQSSSKDNNNNYNRNDYIPIHKDPFAPTFPTEGVPHKRQSVGERRRSEIMGQHRFQGVDGTHCFFNLKVIFEPYKTGFEESKDLKHPKGSIIAGRYEVYDVLGQAAFSTALQCIDLVAEEDEAQWVCLKVIKNNKDFFDQSLDEIKLLQYINSQGDPDEYGVLRLIDFFYCKEHLFIVSELLKENLYEFGRYIRENMLEPFYTLPRLKRIAKQVLEALAFIHSLKLIHCDVKPENIVIKSFSRCEIKLIDFGSSCFTSDHLTTYIQSRSYRAPEVILGHPYDSRIDVWSVGAVMAELFTGYVLFQNDSVPTMLSRITGILGSFPPHVLINGKDSGKYFTLSNIVYERDEDGSFHLIFPKKTILSSRLHLDPRQSYINKSEAQQQDEDLFVDFVRELLLLDPRLRVTASQALQHPWLRDADTVKFSEYIIGQPVAPPPPPQSMPLPQTDNATEYDDDDEEDEGKGTVDDSAVYYTGYDFEEEGSNEEDDDEDDEGEFQEEMYNENMYGDHENAIINDDDEEDEDNDTFEDDELGGLALTLEEELALFQAEQDSDDDDDDDNEDDDDSSNNNNNNNNVNRSGGDGTEPNGSTLLMQ